jgi:iron complex outermembrane receptor protein
MKLCILLFITAINITFVFGQNTFKAVIKDSETKETLIGATAVLQGTTFGATADADGRIEIKNIFG